MASARQASSIPRITTATLVAVIAVVAGGVAGHGNSEDLPLPSKAVVDRVVVYKSAHRLEAWRGKKVLKVYSIAIGRGREGNKVQEGDGITPEGRYTIDDRWHSARFHRFLHISYPNKEDVRRFERSKAKGEIERGASIGGAIGIHGESQQNDWLPNKLLDWTQGCIAVDDDEIEELYRSVRKGAPIVIHP